MHHTVFPGEFPYLFAKKSSENSLKQCCTALFPISSRLESFLHFQSKGTLKVSDRLLQMFNRGKEFGRKF